MGKGVVTGEFNGLIDSVTWSLLLHVRLFLRCASLSPCLPFFPSALLKFRAVGLPMCSLRPLWNEKSEIESRTGDLKPTQSHPLLLSKLILGKALCSSSQHGRELSWKATNWESAKVSHKRVFALLTPEIHSYEMAQMLQKPVFALPGCQRTSVNTLLCDTLALADKLWL